MAEGGPSGRLPYGLSNGLATNIVVQFYRVASRRRKHLNCTPEAPTRRRECAVRLHAHFSAIASMQIGHGDMT
jgi:hypothetical protein